MKINDIKVNKILDSRGEWTIEVEIESEGIKEKASIPSGKSIGSHEVVCLDCEKIKKNLSEFLKDIKNKDFQNLNELDEFLIERAGKNKEKLGGNFTLGVSISFARALAKSKNLELFEYLKNESTRINKDESTRMLRLILNIIGGGVHSFNNLDFQEYWLITQHYTELTQNLRKNSFNAAYFELLIAKIISIINQIEKKLPKPLGRNDEGAFCTNFSDNYEPFLYLKEVTSNLSGYEPDNLPGLQPDKLPGFKPDTDNLPGYKPDLSGNHPGNNFYFELGADIAANQITNIVNWKNVYRKLKILGVKYLEDPYKENEFEKFAELRKEGFKVIGDDLTVTNIERLKIALEKNSVDGVIVKPNQIGTITETFNFVKLAKENNLFTIFSHRSGETNDNWLIDLGIAFGADYFKIGVPLQGERVVKYNRLLEICAKI
ncbi:MAG: enolase [Candidatus Parcubacteria bacterium]|nr:MAG: enolase [Candidatus Parcubacteria bacterium]